jgi:leucyl aminopeptidase (aminopeptidase T)
MISLAAGAEKVIRTCAGVTRGETVLVVTDPGRPPEVAHALVEAAGQAGAETALNHIDEEGPPGGEPPDQTVRVMAVANIVFFVTTRTMFHSHRLGEALRRGSRAGTLTRCGLSTLTEGAIEADFSVLAPICVAVADQLTLSFEARVVAPGGTDLHLRLRDRYGVANTSLCRTPGSLTGIPDIEAYVAPEEGSTEGVVVVDASTSVFGLVDRPIRLIVEGGMVREIEGGEHALRLRALLEEFEQEAVFNLAELGLGLNPMARITGNLIEDEAAYGTGHFALGDNSTFGGVARAPVHVDMVYLHPTVVLDGVELLMNGSLKSLPGFSDEEIEKALRPGALGPLPRT